MKTHILRSALLGLFLAVFPAVAQTSKADPKLQQEFATLYEAWDRALVQVDLKFLGQIYADDLQFVGQDGHPSSKEEMLADTKSGKDVVHSATTDELKAVKHGGTVVVTSRWTSKVTSKGKDQSGQSRWTDVWVKRSGRWQIVSSHGTDISDTEEEAIQKITRLNKEWDEAYPKADVVAMERILAPEFRSTGPDGIVSTKSDLIGGVRSGKTVVKSALSDDLKITVFQNTAVVTGRWTANGVDNGKAWSGAHRFTDTWILQGGHWQVLADHWSKIEKQ